MISPFLSVRQWCLSEYLFVKIKAYFVSHCLSENLITDRRLITGEWIIATKSLLKGLRAIGVTVESTFLQLRSQMKKWARKVMLTFQGLDTSEI